MGRPKVTERKKSKKKTKTNYKKDIERTNADYLISYIFIEEEPGKEPVNVLLSDGKRFFCPNLIKYYRDYLNIYNEKPSQNIADYSLDNNSKYFRIFSKFFRENQAFFEKPLYTLKLELYYDDINDYIKHLWLALGFAACQIDE